MDFITVVSIISIGITAGTPILYAALGEVLAERSGVLNLALEGLMLMGAVIAFRTVAVTNNKWYALLVVIGICGLLGLFLAVLFVTLRVNQIATGVAFTIFCTGLSSIIGKPFLGKTAGDQFRIIDIPFIDGWVSTILDKDALVYLSIILAILLWVFMYKTKYGLHLRAAGEDPAALDSLGINVFAIRYCYVIISAILTGIAGAYLSLAYTPLWIEGMSAGRGWLAIAVVNFALWDPLKAVLGAYLFGVFYALGFRLEAIGVAVPSSFLRMIPYILPLLILIIVSMRTKKKGSVSPKACGVPYVREAK